MTPPTIEQLLGNPLLEEWRRVEAMREKGKRVLVGSRDWTHQEVDDYIIGPTASRHKMTALYSWAVPTSEAIAYIAERFPQVIEIGAGRGYWTSLLTQAGVDMVAYDKAINIDGRMGENQWLRPGFKENEDQSDVLYFPVEKGDEHMILDHQDRVLMLCWPPYDQPFATDVLNLYTGSDLIYIGEGSGGCCADDDFWSLIDRNWEEVECVRIPQWYGIHDFLSHYRRKER